MALRKSYQPTNLQLHVIIFYNHANFQTLLFMLESIYRDLSCHIVHKNNSHLPLTPSMHRVLFYLRNIFVVNVSVFAEDEVIVKLLILLNCLILTA